MAIQVLENLKDAIGNLNPEQIRRHTERPLRLFLYAHNDDHYREMEDFFAPEGLSDAKRAEISNVIHRASEGIEPAANGDLEIYYEPARSDRVPTAPDVFAFDHANPEATIHAVLGRRPDLAIPLAIQVLPFRHEVSRRIVRKVAKENALFALATAVPSIVPFLSLPWSVGEVASDTAILTANQIRMAFLLAAANDLEFGYREQKGEVASIMMGAFGWRALARELVGLIPLGGGLIPKAGIAYAGTLVAGHSLERLYRLGYGYSRDERRLAYADAFERGKALAASVLDGIRSRRSN